MYVCICTCTDIHTYLVAKPAVCLEGRGHVTVLVLQCERSARGTTRGQARQAGARARGGARDLHELPSVVKVDRASVPCVCLLYELDRQCRKRGLTSGLRRVVCGEDRQQAADLIRSVLRADCGRVCVNMRACARARMRV